MNLHEKFEELPERWREYVATELNETGMGYQKVNIELPDKKIEGLIYNSTYLDVSEDIDVGRIEDITLQS